MRNWIWMLVAAVGIFAGGTARAEKWHEMGEYKVDGKDAVEVKVTRSSISRVRIVCTEGSIIINTFVVREGAKKTPHTIGKRIEKDAEERLELGATPATGFRISQDGRGTYKVLVH